MFRKFRWTSGDSAVADVHQQSPPDRRTPRWARINAVAVVAGLALSAAAVMGFSNAAFQASTSNAGNDWTTATVSLTSDATLPLFSAQGPNVANAKDDPIVPGAGYTRQLTITYTGTSPADVKLYLNPGFTETNGLAAKSNLKIMQGATQIYDGLVNAMPTTLATAVGTWQPAAAPTGVDTVYTFTLTVPDDAPMAATVDDITFTWAATSR